MSNLHCGKILDDLEDVAYIIDFVLLANEMIRRIYEKLYKLNK
jgi:hypothetical protein